MGSTERKLKDYYVSDHCFAELTIPWRHTAANRLPILMWQDVFYSDIIVTSAELPRLESGESQLMAGRCPTVFRHTDFCSLYVVSQGSGTHVIDGIPYSIARGDVYTMGQGMEHYFIGCHHLKLDTIHFSTDIFERQTLEVLLELPGFDAFSFAGPLRRPQSQQEYGKWLHLTPDDYLQVSQMMTELRTEWSSNTSSGALLTYCLFVRLLIHLARLHEARLLETSRHTPCSASRSRATIAEAVKYLDQNFSEPIRIHDIASMVFLSHDRFTELFTAIMGRTPRDYLNHLRLQHAKTLLQTSDLSITEIAYKSGFGDATYFIRVFRKTTGITPSVYRRRLLSS